MQRSIGTSKIAEIRPPSMIELIGKRISEKEASTILHTAIKSDNVGEVLAIKKKLPPEEWAKVSRAWLDDIIDKSRDLRTGSFDNVKFVQNIDKFNPRIQQELLGKTTGDVRRLINNIQDVERKVGAVGQPTGFITRIGLLRVAQSIGSGDPVGAIRSGTIFLTPAILNKVLGNRRAVILLNQAFKVAPNTERAVKVGAQLLETVKILKQEIEKEDQSES